MSNTPLNVNSPEISDVFKARFKKLIKNGKLNNEIPNLILEILGSYGIELPAQVKQAIKEYHPNQ
jgi:hypothetical protein